MEALEVIKKNDSIIFKYSGELTLDIIDEIKNEVTSIIENDIKDERAIIFDLSDVSFLDSSGIGFLIHMKNRINAMNKKCYLLRPSNVVKNTLSLVNLINFFTIIDDEGESLIEI